MEYKIQDFADVVNVPVHNPANSGIDTFVGLEHYDIGEPIITRYGSTQMLTTSVKKFEKGDILLARRNVYLRRAGMVDFDGVTSGDSIVIRVRENLEGLDECNHDLLQQLLPFILNTNAFWDYANTNSDGTMSKRLSPQMLLEYEFDLPSLSEQKVLADKLWAAYRLKKSYKKLLAATNEMVKSRFIEMFVDKDYPMAAIKSFANITTGSTPSKSHPEYWGGDFSWVSAEDMKDKYVYTTCESLTEAGYEKCKHLPIDTLMYVCRGSIGVMAINKIECATNQSICTATCNKEKCDVEFLYYALLYKKNNIKQMGTGTSFKSLNQSTFSELSVVLPPIEEQMKFVAIAKQADKSKIELKKSIDSIDTVIKSLINC